MATTNGSFSEFYELVRKNGIAEDSTADALNGWSASKLIEFGQQANDLLDKVTRSNPGNFRFAANESMSGGTEPCMNVECRINHVDSTARFAVFYADHVAIDNPFHKYIHEDFPTHDSTVDILRIMHILHDDIQVALYLKPLFDSGLVGVKSISVQSDIVLNQARQVSSTTRDKLNAARSMLIDLISDFSEGEIYQVNKSFCAVSWTAPTSILEHGESVIVRPTEFYRENGILLPIFTKFTKSQMINCDLLDSFIDPVIGDLIKHSFYGNIVPSHYLSNRDLDLVVANTLGIPGSEADSKRVFDALSHVLPVINTIPLSDLVKIRIEEGDVFKVYRDTLNRSLSKTANLTEHELSQVLDDEIRPEINKIDSTVRQAHRFIGGGLASETVIGSGLLAVGMFSGFITPETASLLAAIGGIKHLSGIGRDLFQRTQVPLESRKSPYYFLWKVQRKAQNAEPI